MPIHANWQNSSLLLWADDDGNAVGLDVLRDRIGEMCSDALLASVAQADHITIQDRDRPALRLAPTEATDFLLCLPQPLPDTSCDSLRYWRELAQFVVAAIHRQLFFPTIIGHENTDLAAWRLAPFDPNDQERLERFASAMPPSCRASGDPIALVESFMAATTDALIRRAAANDAFFSRVHSLATPEAPPEMRWLSALLRDDPRIEGDRFDVNALTNQVEKWISQLEAPGEASTWNIGFKLVEPPDEPENPEAQANPKWRVVVRLHPLDDDAPVTDASELFKPSTSAGALRMRKLADRRSRLSAELQRAAESFPPLSKLLENPSPAEIELTTPEAYEFLRRWAIELKQRSFPVELPEWADEKTSQLGLLMSVSPTDEWVDPGEANPYAGRSESAGARLGLDSLLNFNWRVAVGGEELSPNQFEQLVSMQSPLVKFGGRWMRVDADAAHAAAEILKRQSEGRITLGEAIRAAYGITRNEGGVQFLGLRGSKWIADLLEQSPAQRISAIEQPKGFQGTLRPYQLRGLQWLWFLNRIGIGACLADDMGLGKTIQFIALLLHERDTTESIGPTLLFAPTSVVGNWVRELERFAPSMRVLLHHGPQRNAGAEFYARVKEYDLVITSYALAHRDLVDLQHVPWHRIALDEAQKIKNPSAASSIAIRTLSSPHRVALTGTPIENHLSELWSIMDMLNPGLLGSAREFRERFAVPVERLADTQRAAQLRKMIRPFVLRRAKSEPEVAGDLPEKMEMKVFCTLTAEQAALYQKITAQMLGEIDSATGIRRRGLILAVLTRLKQICDHPSLLTDDRAVLDGRSGKCERLVEMLEEVLEEGEGALVFTQFKEMGDLLQRLMTERLRTPVLYLHGGTPQKNRDEMVQEFQREGTDKRIFLLSLRAGGLGLNLTAANHVFHFDRWWNPAVEAQATDRAHRIGQRRNVQVHKFVCIGTVEERIDKMLSEKTNLAESIVGSGDEWLTSLSTTELAEYLKLSEAAIGDF